jgi:hypothetical protein
MILYTSSTATVVFVSEGLIAHDYGVVCWLVGFVSTLAGQSLISFYMRKDSHRNSYLVFSIGLVIALSAVGMTAESVQVIWMGDAASQALT